MPTQFDRIALYMPDISRVKQMQQHKNVECTDTEPILSSYTKEVKFNEKYDSYWDEFFDMLSEFSNKSDGHFRQASKVKRRIDLRSLDVRPIRLPPHRSEPVRTSSNNTNLSTCGKWTL